MQSLYLIDTKTIMLENNEAVNLIYCLVEERKLRARPIYGIKLFQKNTLNHAVEEYTEPLSYSKSYVMSILDKLIENEVLISNLLQTVDDLVI